MAKSNEQKGRCLCGAVSYVFEAEKLHTGACHCDMCRRWAGGPFMAIDVGADIKFEGADNIAIFHSSKWAERGFCKTCGSNLFYRSVGDGVHFLATGTLDDQSQVEMETEVFIDEKPEFYDFSQETKAMTGAELFALFAPDGEG